MPNFKSVVHFLLVDFVGGYFLLVIVVTGGKKSQLLVPTDLDCTVRLDWSLTKDLNVKSEKINGGIQKN